MIEPSDNLLVCIYRYWSEEKHGTAMLHPLPEIVAEFIVDLPQLLDGVLAPALGRTTTTEFLAEYHHQTRHAPDCTCRTRRTLGLAELASAYERQGHQRDRRPE